MATTFYFNNVSNTRAPVNSGGLYENSTALPTGTESSTLTYDDRTLGSATTGNWNFTFASLAQAVTQSGLIASFTSDPLAYQVISAQTWTGTLQTQKSTSGTFTLAASIYVWRPTANSVVGYLYDDAASLGSFNNSLSTTTFNATGSSVTAFNGDVLVCELWWVAVQTKATSYTAGVNFTTGANTLVSPQTLNYYTAPTRRRVINIT